MAIVPVKRINIIGHSSLKSEILNFLQENGSVQLIETQQEHEGLRYGEDSLETMISDELQNVNFIEDAVSLLEEYSPKKPLLEQIRGEGDQIPKNEFESVADDEEIRKTIEHALNLKTRLEEIRTERGKLDQTVVSLKPWAPLKLKLSSLSSLESSRILTGTLPSDAVSEFSEGLSAVTSLAGFEKVSEENGTVCLCLVFHRERDLEVTSFLSGTDFEEVKLPAEDKSAEDIIKEAKSRIQALSDENKRLRGELEGITESLTKIKARFDAENHRYERLVTRRFVGNTETVFKIRGWIPENRSAEVAEYLEKLGPVKVEIKDPVKEDGPPPVIIENKKAFRPFELVTQLYGMPAYGKIDPTAYLMPFFFIFFGLCLSDAGYGIMLAGAMAVFMWAIGIKGKVYSLFFWGGIATIAGGAATGSWFGVNVLELSDTHWAAFLKKLVMFDPLGTSKEPFAGLMLEGTIAFFYLSVFLGYVQICFGTALSMVYKIMRRETVDGLFDDGAWLMVYIGLAMFIVSMENIVGMPSYGVSSLAGPGRFVIFAGLLIRLFVYPVLSVITGDGPKGAGAIGGKIGISFVLILDNSKNLLGNVLSYSRLMALGLATGIIGSIINMLAIQVAGLIPVLGVILMIIMMVLGHVINLLINLLGSFVHTARLQYVEFFPYFFEGGGQDFRPFEKKYRFVKVE